MLGKHHECLLRDISWVRRVGTWGIARSRLSSRVSGKDLSGSRDYMDRPQITYRGTVVHEYHTV